MVLIATASPMERNQLIAFALLMLLQLDANVPLTQHHMTVCALLL
jgi:hypothetical protein